MLDLDFLRGLIEAVDESGIDSIEVARGGTRVRVAKSPPPAPIVSSPPAPAQGPAVPPAPPAAASAPADGAAPPASAAPAEDAGWLDIESPMVGTFYRAPAPEAPPYVDVGTRVSKGQTLCILEAMKLMNELEAEVDGVVREILVQNGDPVEYGQALFRIEPD
jgi:acetyl-CoA carboxylase biotin carboxyl carrier protein